MATQRDSTIEEAFANTNLAIPHDPTALWRPGGVQGDWSDVSGLMDEDDDMEKKTVYLGRTLECGENEIGVRPRVVEVSPLHCVPPRRRKDI